MSDTLTPAELARLKVLANDPELERMLRARSYKAPASAARSGYVTTGPQVFAGDKELIGNTTFTGTMQTGTKTLTAGSWSDNNYDLTATDGYHTVWVDTDNTDRSVTLPPVSSQIGRTITVMKYDGGTGQVTVKGAAAGENINNVSGTTGVLLPQRYSSITVTCTGGRWLVDSSSGLAITQWVPYTPEPPLNMAVSAGQAGWWRRVGSEIELVAEFAPTVVQVSDVYWPQASFLNGITWNGASLSVDSTKMPTSAVGAPAGTWNSRQPAPYGGVAVMNVSRNVYFIYNGDFIDSNTPQAWASGDWFWAKLKLPIINWSPSGVP